MRGCVSVFIERKEERNISFFQQINEYINKYIYNGINDILAKNDISDDIKIKTRGLIR